MRPPPRVTVCIVTYNHARYVEDCLLSVLGQDPSIDTEILVGDDASGDTTCEIIRRLSQAYPGRIGLHAHPKNLGASRNYQYLIERATGEYIAHLDGDDYWQPGKLRAQLAFMQEHPEVIATYSNALAVGFDKSPVGVFCSAQPAVFDTAYLVEGGNFLCHSSMLYRRSARHVLLDMAEPFIDYRMHLRLSRLGSLGFLREVLVGYRVTVPNSMTATAPMKVRDLYWAALLEACHALGPVPAVNRGLSRFLGAAWLHSMYLRQPSAMRPWIASVRSAFPAATDRILLQSAWAAVALLWQVGLRTLGRKVSGSALRVLFPR